MQQPVLQAPNMLAGLCGSKSTLAENAIRQKDNEIATLNTEISRLNQTLSQYKQNLIDNQIVINKMMQQLKRLDGLRISQAEVIMDLRKLAHGEHRTVGG